MRATAQEIYDALLKEEQITAIKGCIRFHLGDVSTRIKRRDVIGNILQEWLEGWLVAHDIDFIPNANTQMPPDIFLNPDDLTTDMLEIKAFNRECNPAFDIADFKAFAQELIERPYYLDTDFLIFGYLMDEKTGDVIIKDLWLKKLWEIMTTSEKWAIKVQCKKDVIHKIRPGAWCSTKSRTPMFASKEDYLAAFEETLYQYADTHASASQWKNKFKQSYNDYYGEDIDFPRWEDIKDKYKKQ